MHASQHQTSTTTTTKKTPTIGVQTKWHFRGRFLCALVIRFLRCADLVMNFYIYGYLYRNDTYFAAESLPSLDDFNASVLRLWSNERNSHSGA